MTQAKASLWEQLYCCLNVLSICLLEYIGLIFLIKEKTITWIECGSASKVTRSHDTIKGIIKPEATSLIWSGFSFYG